MNGVIVVYLFFSFQKHLTKATTVETTAPIETRIELLKRELLNDMQEERDQPGKNYPDEYSELYEYVDDSNKPITPISIFDKRKLENKFKLPELISTTTAKFVASDTSSEEKEKIPLRAKKHEYKKGKKPKKPIEIFYRRMIFDDERNKPQKWTHCLDVITPFLNGYKDNDTNVRKIDASDRTIKRLSRLLSQNVTNSTRSDIRSILYQISEMQLRVFQWDITAVRTIFNVIIKNRTHDFKGLKYGLKDLFTRWKLDLSDVDTLMKQTKIIRPPCIQVSDNEGSTIFSNTKSTTATEKNCPVNVPNC